MDAGVAGREEWQDSRRLRLQAENAELSARMAVLSAKVAVFRGTGVLGKGQEKGVENKKENSK